LCKNPVLQALFQKREGSEAGSGSGSAPLTNGAGSWRLKDMRNPHCGSQNWS